MGEKQSIPKRYSQVENDINIANSLAAQYSDKYDQYLNFDLQPKKTISHPNRPPLFWRMRSIVSVSKVSLGGEFSEPKNLDLGQFYRIYSVLQQYGTVESIPRDEESLELLRQSLQIDSISIDELEVDENECCICMDRMSEIVLNCNHAFCEECLLEWNKRSETCPYCRKVANAASDDVWVITSDPSTEIGDFFCRFVDNLCS
eukprot:TRINITY_DN8461_c0_g1_i1.p1 TRINITY_DN8461_c0_g1~~TRINITY_DN8461_c0_g1_i1.p1  ORF type:complete len:203 (-),score=44.73 TRINITY_DN8461_c0_g1_i1:55-663(-)